MMTNDTTHERPLKTFPIVAVLIIGAFVAILNQTLLVTALPPIMDDLGITENTAQWLTTVFMLVNGIMIPITAFLTETFTTRRLFLVAMGLFATGTFIAMVSPNFSILMVGRVVQASGAGIMMPLMQTTFFRIFPLEKRGQIMGLVGLVIAFAPAIGPTLSGYLIEHLPWRSVFYVVFPIAVIDLIIAYFVMKNVTVQTFPKIDILSIVLSTLGFGGLLYGFSTAGSENVSFLNTGLPLIVGAVALVWFIYRQLNLKEPILEFRVFKVRIFTLSTIISMIVFMTMIGVETILPIYMQKMLGFSPLESGLMLLPGAIFMGLLSPITGRIFDKFGARRLAIIGLMLVTVGTGFLTQLTATTSFMYLVVFYTLRMIGTAMVMMPVTTAGLNAMSTKQLPHGTAMSNTMRQISASVGTAMLVTIMTTMASNDSVAGQVHGVSMALWVATALTFVAGIMSLFIHDRERASKPVVSGSVKSTS
ncbi:DHA2 family efflux MFS transporter permease subunit [Bacillaceae bacterium SIJ1]|uniref:DHA2 family efflux MFS transporter permease subunit n=1 Tax=Litoribacterium kuwaitense TaxID=1398745 RepID=UPI0013EC9CA8|nr:DHA2 family efflux MFS transporter permease subunit [Litoribacterium kuwaitense]NGP44648.1 DHA2 family efflux MFS transporter permease subunit [Litoribacterium kuwaitense]